MFKKAKLYSLLAIIVASTVVGLFGTQQTVSAQESVPSLYINPDIQNHAKAAAWRGAMLSCLRQYYDEDSNLFITRANLANGKWFPADADKNVGYLVEPTDGRYECNEDGFVSGFRAFFGWSNPFVAGCDLGFYALDGKDCMEENSPTYSWYRSLDDGKDRGSSISIDGAAGDRGDQTAIAAKAIDAKAKALGSNKYYGQSLAFDPDRTYFNGAINYVVYTQTLFAACGLTGPTTTQPAVGEGLNYVKLNVVHPVGDDSGKATVTEVWYKHNSSTGKKYVSIASDGSGGNSEMSCSELVTGAANNSAAYIEFINRQSFTDADLEAGLPSADPSGATSTSTCRVDGIGWLVCPIMNLMASMADSAYYILDNSLLRVAPILITDEATGTNTSLYESWKVMRNLANIAFIVAFLVIVFSQITTFGVSNYGIKRLFPKMIIAALMVNLSYFICAIAVDISNILGSQLKVLLDSVAGNVAITPEGALGAASDGGGISGFVGWTTITTGTLIAVTATGGGMAVLPVLALLLLSVLSAVFAVVVTLILRQVLIILLIVISPLAFIALLLPNTEDYFKKWRTVFQTLLLLYPIISLVFGASALASTIIMGAAEAAPTSNDGLTGFAIEGVGGVTQTLMQLTGAAAAVLPLFIVPALMKLAGGVLNRFAGIVNDPSKGFIDSKKNNLRDSRKILKAEGIERQGQFANSPRGNRVLGAGNTRRRRVFGRLTAYGANNRELARKDDLARAGSALENTYLGTAEGQTTRNAARAAKEALHSTELRADTVYLNSPEGIHHQTESTELEARKQLATIRAKTEATNSLSRNDPVLLGQIQDAENLSKMADNTSKIVSSVNANTDIKMQTKTSTDNLSNVEARDSRDYENTVAGTPPTGVSAATAAAAANVREDSKVISSATDSAKRVSEDALSERILTNPGLAAQMGGIDPQGAARAQAKAKHAIERGEREELEVEKSVVENSNLPELKAIIDNPGSSSRQIAAALDRMITIGSPAEYQGYVNRWGSDTTADSGIIRHAMTEALSKNTQLFKASDLDVIRNGQMGKERRNADNTIDGINAADLASMIAQNAARGVLSPTKMVIESSANIMYAFEEADLAGKIRLSENAREALSNETLRGQIKHNAEQIQRLASFSAPLHGPFPPPPPSQRPDDV